LVSTDKFPEAFRRFKQRVNVNNIQTFRQLTLAFGSWSGERWRGTSRQMDALAVQARKLGIEPTGYRAREEQIRAVFKPRTVIEHQKEAKRERGFSTSYSSFDIWLEKITRTTAYQRRVINFIKNHPNASLAEARGHKTKRR
jgi:hypothetical protein